VRADAPNLTDAQAVERVFRDRPDLYTKHRAELTLDGSGVSLGVAAKARIGPVTPVSRAAGPTTSATMDLITAKVDELLERCPGVSKGEALDRVLSENPSLYASYVSEIMGRPQD